MEDIFFDVIERLRAARLSATKSTGYVTLVGILSTMTDSNVTPGQDTVKILEDIRVRAQQLHPPITFSADLNGYLDFCINKAQTAAVLLTVQMQASDSVATVAVAPTAPPILPAVGSTPSPAISAPPRIEQVYYVRFANRSGEKPWTDRLLDPVDIAQFDDDLERLDTDNSQAVSALFQNKQFKANVDVYERAQFPIVLPNQGIVFGKSVKVLPQNTIVGVKQAVALTTGTRNITQIWLEIVEQNR
jgi:hypothetical protein